jgi:hypothetical protein
MIKVTLAAALATGLIPAPSEAGDLWRSFRTCLSDALAAETQLMPLTRPAPGQSTLSVRCRGDSAAALFDAMAAVGKQDSASGLETRSSEAVQCFRFAGAPVTFECMVTIAVGVPFRDGL